MRIRVESLPNGLHFKEIIHTEYAWLKQLRDNYAKAGANTWLNLYNVLLGVWVLTIVYRIPTTIENEIH